MAQNHFLAGVAKVLMFDGDELIGVGRTYTDSTFNFSISAEDIRGGAGNSLWGKFYHDSNLAINLTDSMFKLEYVAAELGVDIEQGGLSLYESTSAGETVATQGRITLTHTPVAFDGSMIGWYKKPTDAHWSVATVSGNQMIIPNAQVGDTYCIKYRYQNPDTRFVTIKTQYIPKVLHLVMLNDLFSGDISNLKDATKYGRIITDVPLFQLDGNLDLSLTSVSAATTALVGNALSVISGDTCEEEPYYGTMTEEIFGAKWQDNVAALAIENSDIELASGQTEELIVRAIYHGKMASGRKSNDNFDFAVESGNSQVSATGVVTASGTGDSIISVTLKGRPEIVAYAQVSVT